MRALRDRWTAPNRTSALAVAPGRRRAAVRRRAARANADTADQPRGSAGISWRRAPWLAGIAIVAALPAPAAGHELDEYLQAARVSLTRGGILCEIDLTPGAEIAGGVLALVDRNGDGGVTPDEAEAYGRAVLGDVAIEIDGRAVALALTRVEVPAVGEMRDGIGTIQVRAGAGLVPAAGRRRVRFRNDHQPAVGVYLVNALVPEDRGMTIASQVRDPLQHEIRLEYEIQPELTAQLLWLFTAGAVMAGLMVGRRRSSRWTGASAPAAVTGR